MVKKIYVGELGKSRFIRNIRSSFAKPRKKSEVMVAYVLEEDGTKSWQLNPSPHSDVILKWAFVEPLEREVRQEL